MIENLRWLAILNAVGIMGCATTFEPGAPRGEIDVIAHRGASAYAPENTLSAFELAVEQGAHWFELDCTLSEDGEVVVIHDDTVDRTTNSKGAVSGLTVEQLARLDAGTWFDPKFAGERVPTLAEALDLARNRIGVYIEIKNSDDDTSLIEAIERLPGDKQHNLWPGQREKMIRMINESGSRNLPLTRRIIELVRKKNMEKQVVIQSFSPIICAVALGEAPELRTELLACKVEDNPDQWPAYLRWCYLIQAHGFNPDHEDITKELVDNFHRSRKTVAVWTVDEPAQMRRCAQLGVDAIITNKPDVCLETLDEMNGH